jgi:hypothetical protein
VHRINPLDAGQLDFFTESDQLHSRSREKLALPWCAIRDAAARPLT